MCRVESHTGAEMHQVPHYPEAYLESKHCKVFAHWQRPRGVSVRPVLAHASHPKAHHYKCRYRSTVVWWLYDSPVYSSMRLFRNSQLLSFRQAGHRCDRPH